PAELLSPYTAPALQAFISHLPARCRAAQPRADLSDLNVDIPPSVAGAVQGSSTAEALGWLFVSEGSKLGAAFLIKRAE
ncbi:biliverdin-producing heme oxygenase, partial [Pseudomonas syringae pv. tagetis]